MVASPTPGLGASPLPSTLKREEKLARWLRLSAPSRLLSFRKRLIKLKLATLATRFKVEFGDTPPGAHVSEVTSCEGVEDPVSLLYHDVSASEERVCACVRTPRLIRWRPAIECQCGIARATLVSECGCGCAGGWPVVCGV